MFLAIALGLSLPVMIAVLVSGQDLSPGILLSVISCSARPRWSPH